MSYDNGKYQVLGLSEEQARIFEERAKDDGATVIGRRVWTGPIPERGSYMLVDHFLTMSTPEFFFYRRANELGRCAAIRLGFEMCGHYQTNASCPHIPEGEVVDRERPQTSVANLFRYIWQVHDTPEGERALEVLAEVVDGAESPEMAVHLYHTNNS